ncbi:MAG: hemolysin III family protein [Candidatus Omnitrophica bacterium]|nr:hemolysin III family protein [Candidatus Omnitrophota bacterium]MBD3269374.1 hemolysin III family protein [Candidatus Omnitrophota bacterium]
MFGFISNLRQPIDGFLYIIGAVLSIVAITFLTIRIVRKRKAWHIVAFSVYGISLVGMFTVSALYHSLQVSQAATNILRQVDHAMIYFLIVGSSTPIFLIVLRKKWRWSLFSIAWILAIAGIALRLIFRNPPYGIIVIFFIFYIIIGWLLVIAWRPLVRALPKQAMVWMVSGGVLYTLGAAVLNIKWFDSGQGFGAQQIWPFFVMAGSFCHFWLAYKYIIHMAE